MISIRAATAADLPAIRGLFNALIPTTTVAWRDHLATKAEIADWFDAQEVQGNPVLVAEEGGEVLGYTTWDSFRGGPRFPGYRHTAELTIHVDGTRHGGGVGRRLLGALIDLAAERGIHVLVAGVDAENQSSIRFHEAMGFAEVARMPEVGRKHDRWLDLVLLQRIVS